jgi:hypothetical protein
MVEDEQISEKRRVRLRVIPEPSPGTRSILRVGGKGTVLMKGGGDAILECGNCGVPLLVDVWVSHVRGIVAVCPSCESFNETP